VKAIALNAIKTGNILLEKADRPAVEIPNMEAIGAAQAKPQPAAQAPVPQHMPRIENREAPIPDKVALIEFMVFI